MSTATISPDARNDTSTSTSLSGAFARTAARAVGLYFSRPVRLFRPQKVSAWTSLRGLAHKEGASLTPSYVTGIFKENGWSLIRRHFIPPLVVNTALGTLLFTTYTVSTINIAPYMPHRPTTVAALAGATAGAVHGLAGAPADNIARLIEGGSIGWRQAWKVAFRGPDSSPVSVQEAKEARKWIYEWKHMAGRGWHGWKWSCVKDVTGFSVFFTIFDLSRRIGNHAAVFCTPVEYPRDIPRPAPARLAQGLTLVSGGVIGGLAYEAAGRPWDIARELVIFNNAAAPEARRSLPRLFSDTLRAKGPFYFWRSVRSPRTQATGAWYWNFLPTVARVGPWGVAFLLWEGIGGNVDAV